MSLQASVNRLKVKGHQEEPQGLNENLHQIRDVYPQCTALCLERKKQHKHLEPAVSTAVDADGRGSVSH